MHREHTCNTFGTRKKVAEKEREKKNLPPPLALGKKFELKSGENKNFNNTTKFQTIKNHLKLEFVGKQKKGRIMLC